MRHIATQKAQGCCQEIRVTAEVRPTDAPVRAVGSVGNSLRGSNPTVGGPMSSRTVLSTGCSGVIAYATGIFKAGSVRSDPHGSLLRPAKLFYPEPFRTTDYAFGVKKPRRRQIRQRPASSRARGIVPACPARCRKWSPNVQMPAPSGTRIGAMSSAVRGAEVLFPLLLTASLRSTALPGLGHVRMVNPRSPAERLLARLALPWLAGPSCPQWEAASRPGPQCAWAASAGLWVRFPVRCCCGAPP